MLVSLDFMERSVKIANARVSAESDTKPLSLACAAIARHARLTVPVVYVTRELEFVRVMRGRTMVNGENVRTSTVQ